MKNAKKLLSIFLAITFVFSCFSLALTATAASNLPIIYIQGQGADIKAADGSYVYEGGRVPVPEDIDLGGAVKECLPLFASAIASGDWTEYREKIMSIWEPIYAGVRLDNNGEPTNGTYADINNVYVANYPYAEFGAYHFWHDWRLDPFYNAEILNAYINGVLEKTGASKANFVCRCEGVNIFLAYLATYGSDKVNCVELYVSAANGFEVVSTVFSGNYMLNPKALEEYYNSMDLDIEDETVVDILNSVVDFLVTSYSFSGACALLAKIFPKLYKEFVSDMLLCSYGTFPGLWSIVCSDDYADAKERLFEGKEEEYAGLIKKIDKYDKEVRQRVPDLLDEAKANGAKVAIIAKYIDQGFSAPISKKSLDLSDRSCSLYNASHGATSSKRAETLSEAYLAKADPKYISPDKRVDSSTCYDPDHTWIIYNSDHKDFNRATDVLLLKFFETNGEMTVFSDPNFPQYLYYNGNSLEPMKAEHVTVDLPQNNEPLKINSSVDKFVALIKKLVEIIKNFFINLFKR